MSKVVGNCATIASVGCIKESTTSEKETCESLDEATTTIDDGLHG